jgi:hypothetical protein
MSAIDSSESAWLQILSNRGLPTLIYQYYRASVLFSSTSPVPSTVPARPSVQRRSWIRSQRSRRDISVSKSGLVFRAGTIGRILLSALSPASHPSALVFPGAAISAGVVPSGIVRHVSGRGDRSRRATHAHRPACGQTWPVPGGGNAGGQTLVA